MLIRYLGSVLIGYCVFTACAAPKLYRSNRYSTTVISEETLNKLKSYLQKHEVSTVKDTIIIKYNFNGDDCWRMMDSDQQKLESVLSAYQAHHKMVALKRPNVSIFEFSAKGKNQNNYKLNNSDILIDEGDIRELLFKEPTTCGSSILILPTGKCLIVKSDSHFEALNLNSKAIDSLLTN